MHDFADSVLPVITTAVRWSARTLSVLILLFWGFFIAGHLLGDAGNPSRPLMVSDYIILTTIISSLVGLALAWKWELTGAVVTLVAILTCAIFNWKVLLFPGTLIPIAACLFLFCWGMRQEKIKRACWK